MLFNSDAKLINKAEYQRMFGNLIGIIYRFGNRFCLSLTIFIIPSIKNLFR